MNSRGIGFCYLALAQAFVGANITISKYLVTQLPPFVFLQIRFICSFSILLILSRFSKKLPLTQWRKQDWLMMFAQGLTANFLFNAFVVNGVSLTSALAAGIITSFIPGIIALMAWILLREQLKARQIICIGLGIIGLLSISLGAKQQSNAGSSLVGMLLVFISLFPEALYTIFAKGFQTKIPQLQQALWILFFSCISFLPCFLWQLPQANFSSVTLLGWGLLFVGASFSACFFIFWPYGLRHISGSTSALFVAIMPITVVIIATTLLGEHLNKYDIIGFFLVFTSIIFGAIQWKARTRKAWIVEAEKTGS
ncbi:MAG: DMT family transporter [Legionellales bacterium]|nr:DMT family transporter [Legionellales bacterium]